MSSMFGGPSACLALLSPASGFHTPTSSSWLQAPFFMPGCRTRKKRSLHCLPFLQPMNKKKALHAVTSTETEAIVCGP